MTWRAFDVIITMYDCMALEVPTLGKVIFVTGFKGGVGKIIEYSGEGVKTLSVPERATITNMGAELGATTSIFPSDEITKEFLKAMHDYWFSPVEDDK